MSIAHNEWIKLALIILPSMGIGYAIASLGLCWKTAKHKAFVITELYSDENGESHFNSITIETPHQESLGLYSEPQQAKELSFRKSIKAAAYNFHNAPQKQYIIYLSGEAEIETSTGEKRIFKAGDILLANDLNGKGHKSTITKNGRAVIVAMKK